MRKNTNLKTNRILKIVLLISIISSLIYLNRNVLIYRNLINYLETKQTEAVIINEKENMRLSHFTGLMKNIN